jgi:hypothetical protein
VLTECNDAAKHDARSTGVVARISLDALRYGQEISRLSSDFADVASCLYRYNTLPLSTAVARVLPTPEALDRFLGMSGPESLLPLLRSHWALATSSLAPGQWYGWVSRAVPNSSDVKPLIHKLYVSPKWEQLGAAIRLCLPVLLDIGAPAFKWGRQLTGILRPDKFVIYFQDRDTLVRTARHLQVVLRELPAQGVPFTTEIGGAGLLSWAKDPLPFAGALATNERQSWRQWVCIRLAKSLTAPLISANGVEPWELALAHLHAEGVDPESWTWRCPA